MFIPPDAEERAWGLRLPGPHKIWGPVFDSCKPTKLGFTHEIYYAWATSWFKLRSIIAWSGFVWIIRLGIIISIVAIFKDRDVHPGHSYYFCSEINQCWYSRLPHLLLFVGIIKEIVWISTSLCDSELSWILKLLITVNLIVETNSWMINALIFCDD